MSEEDVTYYVGHNTVVVTDQYGDRREVCMCQVEDKHIMDDGTLQFPVNDCGRYERNVKYGINRR